MQFFSYLLTGVIFLFIVGFIRFYFKNSKNNFYRSFYPNGSLKENLWLNRAGKKEEMNEKYHENGKLFIRAFYTNGIKNGRYQEFDSHGNAVKDVEYKDGAEEKQKNN